MSIHNNKAQKYKKKLKNKKSFLVFMRIFIDIITGRMRQDFYFK